MTLRLRPLLLLLAVGALACFTGDELVDQPCERDADCNPRADLLGESLKCSHGICGHAPVCGDGIVDELEACDDGDRVDADACTDECVLPRCGDGVKQAPEASSRSRSRSRSNAASWAVTIVSSTSARVGA